MKYGFVIDNRRCIGCHACSTACKSENEVPLGVHRTWVKYTETGRYPETRRHFQVTRCNHCDNAPCARICPVTAMYQRADGIVEFDKDVCIGCKACIQACPYDAIHIDPENRTAAKCHYCAHRVDLGLEPACVVVCPEHAIIAGDMDDPTSEIARVLAREDVTVRKPEQGTSPKLFYIEGHAASMVPTAARLAPERFLWADSMEDPGGKAKGQSASLREKAKHAASGVAIKSPGHQGLPGGGAITLGGGGRAAEQMVQVAYNAEHKIYWHWQVPAYVVAKDLGAGLFVIMWLLWSLEIPMAAGLFKWTSALSVLATLVTTALLVFDLERPERFFSILLRPQWKSWLARGAFLLTGFGALSGAFFLGQWVAPEVLEPFQGLLLHVTAPLAIMTSIYTAFLFGQAEGRDLWQKPLLPAQFLVRSWTLGAAATLALDVGLGGEEPVFVAIALVFGLLVSLFLTVAGELMMPHASEVAARAAREMLKGRYRLHFWGGGMLLGHVVPIIVISLLGFSTGIAWALLPMILLGFYFAEHAFVMAPQRVPNS